MRSVNGTKMLRAVQKFENKCQKITEKQLPRMGKKAPTCYEHLGQVLAYADMIGSCTFGCPGPSEGAHAIWYLLARTSSFGRAAIRLAKMGFYDEALILVRSVGEIANLFALFIEVPGAVDEWRNSDRIYRLKHFSPAQVRKRISAVGGTIVMDESKYASLCEISTHPVPNLRPQRFNHAGKSMTGGIIFQGAGFLVALNELAMPASLLLAFAARVCKVPREPFDEITKACGLCLRSAGGVVLGSVETVWRKRET
jgi:hypothetical protein